MLDMFIVEIIDVTYEANIPSISAVRTKVFPAHVDVEGVHRLWIVRAGTVRAALRNALVAHEQVLKLFHHVVYDTAFR